MIKKHLYIEQLSKNKYHNNSNNFFITTLISLILIILILTSIWIFYGRLDVIIKTNGIIKYQDNISTIYNIKGGFLKNVVDKDTRNVKKGDLLFEIKRENIENRKKYLRKKIKKDKRHLDELIIFKKYLLFDSKKDISKIEILKNEVELIKEKVSYYNKKIDNKKKELSNLEKIKGSGITEMEYLTEKEILNKYIFELKSIINDKAVELDNRISKRRNNIDNSKLEIKKIYNDLEKYKVKSPINGRIEFIRKYNVGDYIPAGKEVLKIIPASQDKFIVDIIVKNKDVLRIEKNDLVRYRISSYPYKKYGIAEGKVLKIDQDATNLDNENYVYKITANIKNHLIKGDKRKYVNYRNGMLTKATVVVDKRKIIYYILEKLDFLNIESI